MLILTGIVGAQAQRNTLLVYGTASYGSVKQGNTTADAFSISPALGYQWSDNWTAGVHLDIVGGKNTDDAFKQVGPFLRYTQPLGGIFAIYGQVNGNYIWDKNSSGYGATIFPAIGMNLKNSFALNFSFGSLGFSSLKTSGESERVNGFNVSFGSGATFGISKNFGLTK